MTPDVVDLLKQLGERFGVGIDYLWPLVVAFTRWANTAWLVIDAVWLILIAVVGARAVSAFQHHFYQYNNRRENDNYVNYEYHGAIIALSVVALFACCIVSIAVLTHIPGHVAGVFVPEAKALYDLAAQLTAKK